METGMDGRVSVATSLRVSVMTADFPLFPERSRIIGSLFVFPLGFVSAVWCQSRPGAAAADGPSRSDCQGTPGRSRPSLPLNPSTEDRCRNLGSCRVQSGSRRSVRAAIDCNPVSDGAEPPEISRWVGPKQPTPPSGAVSRRTQEPLHGAQKELAGRCMRGSLQASLIPQTSAGLHHRANYSHLSRGQAGAALTSAGVLA